MGSAREHRLERDGTSLSALEWGAGPPVLLLHGLAGHAGEGAQTASWLARRHRVLAPDQRGHGHSLRRPADLSRAAFVADAAAWIERLGCAPAIVCGQSLGGHTALLLDGSFLIPARLVATLADGNAEVGGAAAANRRLAASSVAPIRSTSMNAPCVLARLGSRRPGHHRD